jgi:hypothetical protein
VSSDKDWWLDFLLMMGFGAGLYSFLKGFRIYREYRLLEDTPQVPIHGIAMGLVHLSGRAMGEETLTSPVTRTPCYFYKVDVEKWEHERNRSGWRHYRTDTRGVRFYLEDPTGKVLLDPHGAECDLLPRRERVIGDAGFSWRKLFEKKPAPLGESEPTDEELEDYLANRGAGGPLPASVEEAAAQARQMLGGVEGIDPSQIVFARAQTWTLGSLGPVSGRFRLTEYSIVPEEWYNVTGTCVENLRPKDEGDRNLIVKGESEPTFLISWRDEEDIESGLRWRALRYIFGGGAAAIACLYIFILLVQLGWI